MQLVGLSRLTHLAPGAGPGARVANSVPPSKKPCELAVPSVACPKMLKTFTNLPILTFFRSSMRNRCFSGFGLPDLLQTCYKFPSPGAQSIHSLAFLDRKELS